MATDGTIYVADGKVLYSWKDDIVEPVVTGDNFWKLQFGPDGLLYGHTDHRIVRISAGSNVNLAGCNFDLTDAQLADSIELTSSVASSLSGGPANRWEKADAYLQAAAKKIAIGDADGAFYDMYAAVTDQQALGNQQVSGSSETRLVQEYIAKAMKPVVEAAYSDLPPLVGTIPDGDLVAGNTLLESYDYVGAIESFKLAYDAVVAIASN